MARIRRISFLEAPQLSKTRVPCEQTRTTNDTSVIMAPLWHMARAISATLNLWKCSGKLTLKDLLRYLIWPTSTFSLYYPCKKLLLHNGAYQSWIVFPLEVSKNVVDVKFIEINRPSSSPAGFPPPPEVRRLYRVKTGVIAERVLSGTGLRFHYTRLSKTCHTCNCIGPSSARSVALPMSSKNC